MQPIYYPVNLHISVKSIIYKIDNSDVLILLFD